MASECDAKGCTECNATHAHEVITMAQHPANWLLRSQRASDGGSEEIRFARWLANRLRYSFGRHDVKRTQ